MELAIAAILGLLVILIGCVFIFIKQYAGDRDRIESKLDRLLKDKEDDDE